MFERNVVVYFYVHHYNFEYLTFNQRSVFDVKVYIQSFVAYLYRNSDHILEKMTPSSVVAFYGIR